MAPLVGGAIAGATFHLITGVDRRDRDIIGELEADDVPHPDKGDPLAV